MKVVQGDYRGEGLKIAVVVPRFNDLVTSKLLEGALDGLKRHGVSDENITVVRIPGSMEAIYTLKRLLDLGVHDAIIVLGAVIRGETYHFNVVANEIGKAVAQFNMTSDIPIVFGVLTTDTLEQALNRAGAKSGNKGFEAAMVAIEMANLRKRLRRDVFESDSNGR
ncbi:MULTISPECIES: 6,7-dimethyl-8-ribityllumazine synthase [Thermotoga]|jgi:6,7-dimethyl-8-ribityllumazine synthase|uniref:6,7-dimethyl-8-ribityllumazine synthase n=3 Tax=Thermotoga TaxID=2335 RepID=RISB_THEMA|nr:MULTISPECIES: 6,7-dimethyl-8-ribityllumazine synthase [Thermotoga]B1LAJ8.1 RecName: Full=6,7-dimethyl-8-ribityllumazine synthase; Short=DMRL synthase; Short=LS; Short=Lumazine synthase [Thermotoga sp. RQ2]Q9X2E5.1 RecName: Full=6,7-dimethyl-8-ribityllumazine synthase; Short=DMRL synthase; Short=LS; Short=Lumazine synthase [Thermotoga maritima MSB8]MDK2898639.1 6,7-dimethyl-8-ribityllumazine synthase [Thermotoga sp.]AAD36888.1 6,7-dimethyl-8-ribityllumazine synthase [Thermotoga maritima MSB8]